MQSTDGGIYIHIITIHSFKIHFKYSLWCVANQMYLICVHFFFFFPHPPPKPPNVPYGLRGLPSQLWPKCNWLLRLGRPWGAVTCPDEMDGDIWIWSTRRGLKPKFY
jgi:hypothetical protein